MSGIQPLDLNFFEIDGHSLGQRNSGGQPSMVSHNSGGYHHDSWGSDMEIGTPSTTTGLPSDLDESLQSTQQQVPDRLRPPMHAHRSSSSMHSPHSSYSGVSPSDATLLSPQPARPDERPMLSRYATAPEPGGHTGTKRGGTSDDDDEEYVPSPGDPKQRGRKRQRIPHTAVERRYRENLNAHLDKLRQAVPPLAARKGPGGGKGAEGGEGAKPSKCEILSGAIDHIGVLNKENADLKNEKKALRARIEDMQSWYRSHSR